uniref:Uncharacterized protein n=1 Tax=Aegilops tauschii subsp. strangulata TaxID=200361 RepID=A0A453SHI9_AEGTS
YVGDDTPVSSEEPLSPAPGVETVCVFPKNAGKIVPAGEETELLVGLQNEGESTLNVVAVHSTLHLPYDHKMYGQNLTVQRVSTMHQFLSLCKQPFPIHLP